jgi:hypothetical protein
MAMTEQLGSALEKRNFRKGERRRLCHSRYMKL